MPTGPWRQWKRLERGTLRRYHSVIALTLAPHKGRPKENVLSGHYLATKACRYGTMVSCLDTMTRWVLTSRSVLLSEVSAECKQPSFHIQELGNQEEKNGCREEETGCQEEKTRC